MSWTDGEDKYMAAYRGESVDDAPARCRDCRDSFPQHCGECDCCREAAAEEDTLHCDHANGCCREALGAACDETVDAAGLAVVALAAVLEGLVCRAQLPMGTQQAPVAECECRDCTTARVLCAAIQRLEAA